MRVTVRARKAEVNVAPGRQTSERHGLSVASDSSARRGSHVAAVKCPHAHEGPRRTATPHLHNPKDTLAFQPVLRSRKIGTEKEDHIVQVNRFTSALLMNFFCARSEPNRAVRPRAHLRARRKVLSSFSSTFPTRWTPHKLTQQQPNRQLM